MKLTTDRLTVSLSPQRFVTVLLLLLLLTRGVGGGGAPEELWHLREVLVLELIHIFVVTLDLEGDLLRTMRPVQNYRYAGRYVG